METPGPVYSAGFAKQANASVMAVQGSTRIHVAVVSKPSQGWGADKGGLHVAYKERSSSVNMIPRGYVALCRTSLGERGNRKPRVEKTKKLIARVLDEAGARCTKRASLLLPEMLAYLRVASNRVKGSLWFLFFLFPFFY